VRVRWLATAVGDLERIESWVAERNTLAAVDTIEAVLAAVERLADFPALGRPGRVQQTRELPVTGTPFLVVYKVRAEDVAVIRVLHGARRWPPPQ
jgi:toxin ParE1/3/4